MSDEPKAPMKKFDMRLLPEDTRTVESQGSYRTGVTVHSKNEPLGFNFYLPNGDIWFAMNIVLYPDRPDGSVDIILPTDSREIKILAWKNGEQIANKVLPVKSVTVSLNRKLDEAGR
jgi:hypothetical protein